MVVATCALVDKGLLSNGEETESTDASSCEPPQKLLWSDLIDPEMHAVYAKREELGSVSRMKDVQSCQALVQAHQNQTSSAQKKKRASRKKKVGVDKNATLTSGTPMAFVSSNLAVAPTQLGLCQAQGVAQHRNVVTWTDMLGQDLFVPPALDSIRSGSTLITAHMPMAHPMAPSSHLHHTFAPSETVAWTSEVTTPLVTPWRAPWWESPAVADIADRNAVPSTWIRDHGPPCCGIDLAGQLRSVEPELYED